MLLSCGLVAVATLHYQSGAAAKPLEEEEAFAAAFATLFVGDHGAALRVALLHLCAAEE